MTSKSKGNRRSGYEHRSSIRKTGQNTHNLWMVLTVYHMFMCSFHGVKQSIYLVSLRHSEVFKRNNETEGVGRIKKRS